MSSIRTLLDGGNVERGGLHFMATPDTRLLMEAVLERITKMLDLVKLSENTPTTITRQTLLEYEQFANGEAIATIDRSVRGSHTYYFSDPHGNALSRSGKTGLPEHRSLNDRLTHDILTLGALKENGARTVNLVQLSMPYARQDKATPGRRQAASLDRVGGWISEITGENGHVITMDLHNPASKSSFQRTDLINLYTDWFVSRVIEEAKINHPDLRPVLLPTDQGGDKKISPISEKLGTKHGISLKSRDYSTTNTVDSINVYGEIEGNDVFVHDDILDTGGTLIKLLETIITKKPRAIYVCITHGLFNGEALAKISSILIKHSDIIKGVYVTDSVYRENLKEHEWIKRVSTVDIVSNTIFSIYLGLPIDRGDATNYMTGR